MSTIRLANRRMTETEVDQVLRTAQVGRLGICQNGQPYIVPLNFAYNDNHIYFHSAEIGMKMEFLHSNPSVCFEVDEYVGTVSASVPCNYDTAYRSVIAFGKARILTDIEEKTARLKLIVAKYAGLEQAQKLDTASVDQHRTEQGSKTAVVDIEIERISGKHNATR